MKKPYLNIGSESQPDLICIKSIKRLKKIKGTESWEVWGDITPADNTLPITLSDSQYMEMRMLLDEYEMQEEREEKAEQARKVEQPTIRIIAD